MGRTIRFVPGFDVPNPFMYCNYARMNPNEERCLHCENNCKHKGEKTIIIKN